MAKKLILCTSNDRTTRKQFLFVGFFFYFSECLLLEHIFAFFSLINFNLSLKHCEYVFLFSSSMFWFIIGYHWMEANKSFHLLKIRRKRCSEKMLCWNVIWKEKFFRENGKQFRYRKESAKSDEQHKNEKKKKSESRNILETIFSNENWCWNIDYRKIWTIRESNEFKSTNNKSGLQEWHRFFPLFALFLILCHILCIIYFFY